MSKRLILIGGSARHSDRIDGTDAEVWSCNNLYALCSSLSLTPTRWFELHFISEVEVSRRFHRKETSYLRRFVPTVGEDMSVGDYLVALSNLDIPVYMQRHWPIIPKSIPFPLQDILQRFPRGFFNNSFAYMLALAIIEKFEEIEVYGISTDLETFREYYVHRVSTEYYLGYAEALGIKIKIGHISQLLKVSCLYGYEEQPGDYYAWQKQDQESPARQYINLWRL